MVDAMAGLSSHAQSQACEDTEKGNAMTSAQYRKALERLGLTIETAAPIIGITPRHSYRLAGSDRNVSVTIERLLWLLERHGIPPQWRARQGGMSR